MTDINLYIFFQFGNFRAYFWHGMLEYTKIKSITHFLEIENEHYKHLEIQQATNKYLAMRQLQFDPVLPEPSAQNSSLN